MLVARHDDDDDLSIYRSISVCAHLSCSYSFIHMSMLACLNKSIYLSIYLSIYQPIYVYFHVCLSFYLKICLFPFICCQNLRVGPEYNGYVLTYKPPIYLALSLSIKLYIYIYIYIHIYMSIRKPYRKLNCYVSL